MALKDLRLQQFRSYDDSVFSLSSGVNIIVGPNASGKTNLLEAILIAARGKSYRAKDGELVAFGDEWARIDAHEQDDDAVRTVKLQRDPGASIEVGKTYTCKKTFIIQDRTYSRLSHQKMLPIVLFEPNHLLMLSGSPELRRAYIDDLLEQLVADFGSASRNYKRTLIQRNALLKNSMKRGERPTQSQLFVWNVRLSELAAQVVRMRNDILQRINDVVSAIYQELAGEEKTSVVLRYISSCNPTDSIADYESRMLRLLDERLERDLLLGYTTVGPHRDDFRVQLNGRESQEVASRGENRTIILALKIIELQLLEQRSDRSSPLLLLDDVFSELDSGRRQALTAYLQRYQTFITTTDADAVAARFVQESNVISTTTR